MALVNVVNMVRAHVSPPFLHALMGVAGSSFFSYKTRSSFLLSFSDGAGQSRQHFIALSI
jgi:hypothetical protein